MTSKPLTLLLADLGASRPLARLHVSKDNQLSDPLKYGAVFPDRFGLIQDARAHFHIFFRRYNAEHCHAGLGPLTPHDVHYGPADQPTQDVSGGGGARILKFVNRLSTFLLDGERNG